MRSVLLASSRVQARETVQFQESCERRLNALAARDDFYLRVLPRGYDLGKNSDPDGLLPTVHPKNGG
jgi:hypothetical protein